MSKKWIITLSILFGFVAVLLILFWTLFGLSKVTVSFDSTLENLTLSQEEIVEVGGFKKHSSVLFNGKKKHIKKIYEAVESNENFAYLKITNIETKFPNRYVIHITEREELFAIVHNEKYLICDRELRVLKILDEFISQENQPILVDGVVIKSQTVKVGDFLAIEQEGLKKFYSANLKNNRNLAQQLGKFKQIDLSKYQDEITQKEYFALDLTTFSGQKFKICNIDFALVEKFQLLYAVESALYSQINSQGQVCNGGQPILVKLNENGEYVADDEGIALTVDMLKDITIKVDNLTISDHTPRTEKDIYYCFLGE